MSIWNTSRWDKNRKIINYVETRFLDCFSALRLFSLPFPFPHSNRGGFVSVARYFTYIFIVSFSILEPRSYQPRSSQILPQFLFPLCYRRERQQHGGGWITIVHYQCCMFCTMRDTRNYDAWGTQSSVIWTCWVGALYRYISYILWRVR